MSRSYISLFPFFVACTFFGTGIVGAAAEPAIVGPEMPAEARPTPPDRWWTTCVDARGIRTTIRAVCFDDECDKRANVFVERSDANDAPLSAPFPLSSSAAVPTYYRVTCHADGWVVAQWRHADDSCFVHRVFDPDGLPVSDRERTAPLGFECRARPSVALKDDGSFVAVWANADLTMQSGIHSQAFGKDGRAVGEPAVVTEEPATWNRQPKVLTDETGTALVTWLGAPSDGAASDVLARFLDRDGMPLGTALRLNTFAYGTTGDATVAAESAGNFVVVWSNPLQGGRVARRVSFSGTAPAIEPQTTPHAKPSRRAPRFGFARRLETADGYYGAYQSTQDESVEAAGDGAWLRSSPGGYHYHTGDDGIAWSARTSLDSRSYNGERSVAADATGTAIALVADENDNALLFARSTNGGETWSELGDVAPIGPDGARCHGCELMHAVSKSDGADTWIATWSYYDGEGGRIMCARSDDGGKTWGKLRTISTGRGVGYGGFDLESDDEGTWLLTWSDRDLWSSRSTDGGRTWSTPRALVENVGCEGCAARQHFTRIATESGKGGVWVTVFASSQLERDVFGYDGDVFVLRSADDGATWSEPMPIGTNAALDASRDVQPSLANDGTGRWVATWTSHRPHAPDDDMDADVVISVSVDGGATWSEPVAARRGEEPDLATDSDPLLAADADGVWMLSWRREPFVSSGWASAFQTYAAVADATCGDTATDVGESCDDGNETDGDGCDSDCTETGCGNGIMTDGEECDFGNAWENTDCTAECKLQRCGDGIVRVDYEECDDGNASNEDDCTTACRLPACGDGHVQAGVEECDDGNGRDYDACPGNCLAARCGDGYVQDNVEACDDGVLGVRDDACPDTCDRAVCGDGRTSKGFEECDFADWRYREICSEDCRLIDICGDADGDGNLSIVDVQRILGHGVALDVRCPREACDMDGSGFVRVVDAQIGVAEVVGIETDTNCRLGTGNLIFSIDYEGEIAALQVEIDYRATGGDFLGSADLVACEPLGVWNDSVPDDESIALYSFNDDEHEDILHAALIAMDGFSGPLDLFRCAFEMPDDRQGVDLLITTMDASSPDFTPLEVTVDFRLE
jgi:cysteine-rich repeat protein